MPVARRVKLSARRGQRPRPIRLGPAIRMEYTATLGRVGGGSVMDPDRRKDIVKTSLLAGFFILLGLVMINMLIGDPAAM